MQIFQISRMALQLTSWVVSIVRSWVAKEYYIFTHQRENYLSYLLLVSTRYSTQTEHTRYGSAQFKLHTRVCITRAYSMAPVEHFRV